jgi:hypothetical protein
MMNIQLTRYFIYINYLVYISSIQLGVLGGVVVLSVALGLVEASGAPELRGSASSARSPETKGQVTGPVLPVRPADARAVVPFEMLPTKHVLVRARINNQGPYLLIFDLGAPITVLSNRASEATRVVKGKAPRSFLFGMRGEAEVDKLQVGDVTATKLPVVVFDHPVVKALDEITGRRIDGILGFTFFARYKTTIDYLDHRLTFEPVSYQVRNLLRELPERLMGPKVVHHRVLAPLGLWGLRLGKPVRGSDASGVRISMVYAGSPADRAGLKAGDVLVTLDGRWTTSVADVFHAAADVEPGREAAVGIMRDGKERTLTIRPAQGT